MGLTPQDLAQIAQQNKAPQLPGDYAVPKPDIKQQINSMPNANKLTQTERKIYSALPGVTSWLENNRIMGRTYSEQLDKFNNSWVGKGLQYLDFLAEGLERTSGLVTQMTQPGFDFKNLKAAWYAGSLTYDTVNLPQLVRSKETITDPITGRTGNPVVGLRIPTDLPGAQNGLNNARLQIQRLMEQGYDPTEALSMVRDDYYSGLGALALRAQLNDLYGHALLDPLNVVSAWFKPVQALKARRLAAVTKIAGGVEDIITKADDIAKLANTADNVLDSLKYADEAYQLAQLAGDSKRAAQYGAKLADLAQQAGRIEDAARYTDEIADLTRIIGNAEEAAKYTDNALAALGKKQLNLADKAAIFLTGGDPLRPSAFVKKLEKVPGLGIIAKGFQLTPESKARELMTMFADNIGSNVISRLWDSPTAEADFVNLIHRMKKGATGIEYGHAMLTLEGRTIQSFISGADFNLSDLYRTYQGMEKERNLLQLFSDVTGEGAEKLLRMMDENPSALMGMLTEKAAQNPLLAQMIQSGLVSPDGLRAMSKMFVEGVPYNKEMFFAQAMDVIETSMMRQAVVQFGVEAKGVLTRWSDALKSAESLAFLRLSPSYPVRNAINNEITMMARGLFGVVDNQMMDDFWKGMKFSPDRLLQEGISSEVGRGVTNNAERLLDEALRGGNYGAPEKMKEFFKGISLGKLDTAAWGGKLEKSASRRAYTVGTMQYLRQYFKPTPVKNYIDPRVMDEIANLAPDLERNLDNAIRASGAVDDKLDELLGSNLNTNVDSILDDVAERLGVDVRETMGTEAVEYLHQKLPKAIAEGKLDSFKAEMRQLLNNHVEDLFNKQIENVVEHTKAQAVIGGPNVWNKKLAEAQDIFWGAHIEHNKRLPEMTRAAREAAGNGDFALARALWEQEAEDARNFYNRAFRRVDAYMKGLEEGAAELTNRGVKLPFAETRKTFGQWKASWEDFFKNKNSAYDNFWKEFEKAPRGQKPDIEAVRAKIDADYQKQIELEDELMRRIDDQIAGMIDDPTVRQSFINARDTLAELRRQDKAEVIAMYERVRQLPPEERQAAWNLFLQQRDKRLREMKGVSFAASAIQQGDPTNIARFQNKVMPMGRADYKTRQLAKTYGVKIPELKNIVNKFLRGEFTDEAIENAVQIQNYSDIAPELAREALRARLISGGGNIPKGMTLDDYLRVLDEAPQEPAKSMQGIIPNFIAETDWQKVFSEPPPITMGMDEMNYGRVMPMLDEVVSEAQNASRRPPLLLKDLPENIQAEVMKGIRRVKNDFSAVRYRAAKFGEWRRDSALLNYNRRTNFDNWLGHIAPFGFWSTNSMMKWAIESIDRPAMLTNYMRAKKFLATSGLQRDGMATRTKGKIRIELPFAPDWMGEAFIDPLRIALPFDNWIAPFDQWQKEQQGLDGRTMRTLDQMLIEGKISQDEYEEATTTKSGGTWDFAKNLTQQNDDQDRYDAWDFATALQAPHAPLVWAYQASFGDKEDIGPFAPMSRLTRNAATLMGVEDWNNSKWNLEAKIRKNMGLPAFDKWDDYRIKRAASNLAGEGRLTPDEAKEAIAVAAMVESGKLSPEEGKQQSEAYRLAVARSNQEFTGGGTSFALGLLGLSVTSVPEGENNLRALQDDFGIAYGKYKEANDSLEKYIVNNPQLTREQAEDAWEQANPKLAQDADALGDFFDKYPEYETRLGLFEKPEIQVQKFMVDQVWSAYNSLPKVNQAEVREHLGTEFQQSFLDSATRNTDEVPTELMAVWLKLMNTDPLGGLTADQRLLVSLYGKVQMTDPETAWRVETFYNERKGQYPEYYDLQSQYYGLPKNQRKQFLSKNPQLREYWDFRYQFFRDNPDLVPYITDNEKDIARAKNQARTERAIPTAQELQVQLTPEMNEVLTYYFQNGTPLPPVVVNELDYLAQQQGLTDGQQLLNIIQGQY